MNSQKGRTIQSQTKKTVTVFIGGYPFDATKQQLTNYLRKQYPSFKKVMMIRDQKGKSKGFGYGVFGSNSEAEKACNSQHHLKGKIFSVRQMHKKKNLSQIKKDELDRKIFVAGIKKSTLETSLEEYFGQYGQIENILINRDIKSGKVKGCGFILFKEKSVAQQLINLQKKHLVQGALLSIKKCLQKGYKKQKKSATATTIKTGTSSQNNKSVKDDKDSINVSTPKESIDGDEKKKTHTPDLAFSSTPQKESVQEMINLVRNSNQNSRTNKLDTLNLRFNQKGKINKYSQNAQRSLNNYNFSSRGPWAAQMPNNYNLFWQNNQPKPNFGQRAVVPSFRF